MLLLLPCIAYWLLYLILHGKGLDWRRAALAAAVFSGTFIVAVTELLSLPRLLSRGPVALCWFLLCLAAFFYWKKMKKAKQPTWGEYGSVPSLDRATKLLLATAGVLVLLVGITALLSAPNVWDAMEYHLPRTTMWMSNHSVKFFATPQYEQLIFGPWAEFAMMHTELLAGNDRFVNMVQFLSFLLTAIAVSLIAGLLGAGSRGQALSAIAAVTIPQGVLEASGPMNTYVVSLWITITVLYLMLWNRHPSWFNTTCIGLSAGLAVFTKGTAYIVLPFLVLACWCMAPSNLRSRILKHSVVMLVLILAINTPHYMRTYQLTGSPLGFPLPTQYARLQNIVDHPNLRGVAASFLRNISVHVGTPSERFNERVDGLFQSVIWKLGVDPNDHSQVFLDYPFHSNHFSLHEIHAGNPLHFLFLSAAIMIVLWKGWRGPKAAALWYAFGLLLSFMFFCSLVRWNPWSSRFHLPFFLLGSALVGLVLERYVPRKVATTMAALLMLSSLPFALANRTRSLVPWSRVENIYHPRSYQYFLDSHTDIATANIAAADFVNQIPCDRVALDINSESSSLDHAPRSTFVYPLLAQIHADGRHKRVWYTNVQNPTTRYATHESPCAVICFDCATAPKKWDEYKNVGGRASVFDYIVVYTDKGSVLNSDNRGR